MYFGFSSVDVELMPREGLYSVPYNSIDINGYEFVGLGNSRGDTWVLGADTPLLQTLTLALTAHMVDNKMHTSGLGKRLDRLALFT